MNTNYNNFAKSFALSRKNMKWEELEYFFGYLKDEKNILDIGCGSGRLLGWYKKYFGKFPEKYIGIDLSEGLLCEAKKLFPDQDFIQADMLEIENIRKGEKFESIFLIASFHHLDSLEKRQQVLVSLKNILTDTGKIYMTNWALESPVHKEKYAGCIIAGSKNTFGSKDFNIKFGEFNRYYHSFSGEELEYLGGKSKLQIVENRLFDTEKNIVTIFQK